MVHTTHTSPFLFVAISLFRVKFREIPQSSAKKEPNKFLRHTYCSTFLTLFYFGRKRPKKCIQNNHKLLSWEMALLSSSSLICPFPMAIGGVVFRASSGAGHAERFTKNILSGG